MLIVKNHINQVGEEELDNDSREVFKEDKEIVEANLAELRAWILSSAHLKDRILFNASNKCLLLNADIDIGCNLLTLIEGISTLMYYKANKI